MDRFYTISDTLPDGETLQRELKCESKERAMRLMKAKFADATAIRFVSEREAVIGDDVISELIRVESRFRDLEKLEAKHKQQKNRGIVVIGLGVVATVALFFYGWIAWFTLLAIGIGIYEFSNGVRAIQRARRLRSWEIEELES